jgi:osmotically inducible protein OsmC
MKRNASARWSGLQDSKGTVSSASGSSPTPSYSFTTGSGHAGTSPEELIAAAHAACFSMALSGQLGAPSWWPTDRHRSDPAMEARGRLDGGHHPST